MRYRDRLGRELVAATLYYIAELHTQHYLLASERSERDTYRGNTIENRGCLFIGERDSIRGG